MNPFQIKNLPHLNESRKELRNNPTPAEAHLWLSLRNNQLKGRKFRRQHSFENYIVDFYCPAEKLIVEVDGEVHKHPEQIIYDTERTKRLNALGYKLIRFGNRQVFENIDEVLAEIERNFA